KRTFQVHSGTRRKPMRRSNLFTTTLKHIPNEERSINSQMLIAKRLERLTQGLWPWVRIYGRFAAKRDVPYRH
ncbi:MAG TPA: hypothetical protein VN939_01555, partial [Chthoniobacterales bacterium]|nr:hypothetical protein [Chthoniobacterales bacterium]